jgi:hypothetical protein
MTEIMTATLKPTRWVQDFSQAGRGHVMRANKLGGRLAAALALAVTVGAGGPAILMPAPPALSASWHLDSAFGKRGVAGLPVRETGPDSLFPVPGPGAKGTLLARGPQGSLFAGGFSDHKKGSFLIARLSAHGRLVSGFGHGGVVTVPAIYATPERPPRMFALAGGRLLVVGLDRADHLAVAGLTARGRPDRSFGHGGVAQYALPGVHANAIIAAAAVLPDGDMLAAYYLREAPQPTNEPRISPGLGEGPIELVRLLPGGALDRSFGEGGLLAASALSPATGEVLAGGLTIAPDGSILIAYEQASIAGAGAAEAPAVQELTPAGVAAAGFGRAGVALLPFTPEFEGVSSSLFSGLFALPGGAVEVSFGGGGELFRFSAAGTPDPAFGTAGHTTQGPAALALAVAPDGETFALDSAPKLTVGGTLAGGAPDPALGGRRGERFGAGLPQQRPGEQQLRTELLAGDDTLSILIGETVMRITR